MRALTSYHLDHSLFDLTLAFGLDSPWSHCSACGCSRQASHTCKLLSFHAERSIGLGESTRSRDRGDSLSLTTFHQDLDRSCHIMLEDRAKHKRSHSCSRQSRPASLYAPNQSHRSSHYAPNFSKHTPSRLHSSTASAWNSSLIGTCSRRHRSLSYGLVASSLPRHGHISIEQIFAIGRYQNGGALEPLSITSRGV